MNPERGDRTLATGEEIERRVRAHQSLLSEAAISALVAAGGVVLTIGRLAVGWQIAIALGLGAATVLLARLVSQGWARYHTVPLEVLREENGQLRSQLNALSLDRPRLRTEIHSIGPQYAAMYSVHTYWGVEVHNDGAPAEFEAHYRVLSAPEPLPAHLQGSHVLRWDRSEKRRTQILPGASDKVTLAFVNILAMGEERTPQGVTLLRVGGPSDHTEGLREWKVPDGGAHGFLVMIDLTVTSVPPPAEGPRRMRLALRTSGLTLEPKSLEVSRPGT